MGVPLPKGRELGVASCMSGLCADGLPLCVGGHVPVLDSLSDVGRRGGGGVALVVHSLSNC